MQLSDIIGFISIVVVIVGTYLTIAAHKQWWPFGTQVSWTFRIRERLPFRTLGMPSRLKRFGPPMVIAVAAIAAVYFLADAVRDGPPSTEQPVTLPTSTPPPPTPTPTPTQVPPNTLPVGATVVPTPTSPPTTTPIVEMKIDASVLLLGYAWEKLGDGSQISGIYLLMDPQQFAAYLEMSADETFLMEIGNDQYKGNWSEEGDQVTLESPYFESPVFINTGLDLNNVRWIGIPTE